jgi:hypothetical protein
MAHFYGTLQGNRGGEVTRAGSKNSGLTSYSASWNGAIRVCVYADEEGNDCYRVDQTTWHGHGISEPIAEGKIGEK